jgi:flagellar biosynthesis protein FliQ
VAVTLACAGSLALTVAAGSLLIALISGLLACIVFAITIRCSQTHKRSPV